MAWCSLDSPDRDNADDAEVEEDAERQSVDDSERRAAGARATSSTSPHPASSPSLQGGGIRLQRPHAPQQDFVLQRFKGHRNSQTVKVCLACRRLVKHQPVLCWLVLCWGRV